jgi:hypothetical protein
MDIANISDKIQKMINELNDNVPKIEQFAKKRAQAIADYEVAIGKEMVGLRSKEKMPVSMIEKVAKGNCYLAKIEMEKCDTLYKGFIKKLDVMCAVLNGYQSMNRYLDKR